MGRILMGSQYFFSCYDGFHSKDIDEIELVDNGDFNYVKQLTGQGKCVFWLKKQPNLDNYINWALQSESGMVIGKFLIPEFNELIGFTIKDLPRVKPLIDKLDKKHLYEKIIYESYIENNAFELTDAQRLKAYKSYKESRGK